MAGGRQNVLAIDTSMFCYRVITLSWVVLIQCLRVYSQRLAVDDTTNINNLQRLHHDSNHDSHVTSQVHWSGSPRCVNSSKASEDFCVYSSTDFADGRGISLLTEPSQAAKFLQLPSFTDGNILSSLGANEVVDPPFYPAQIDSRGTCLIANRTIRRGEWLMSFTPAFMMLKEAVSKISRQDRLSLQRLSIKQLPLPLQNSTYGLYSQRGDAAYDLVDDILDTNTFELPLKMDMGDDDEILESNYKVLFPEIARFNHACRPTADYFFDSSLLVLHIIAFREVLPGEELTITYIDPLQTRQARQNALRSAWGFTCNCAACSVPLKLAQASDARIDTIIRLQNELVDRAMDSKGSPAQAERLISLLRQEQLWTLMHDGYFAAAIEYSGIGDAANAQHYARLAQQSRLLCRGPEAVDDWHSDMLLLSSNPQHHPSWRFRILR